MQKKKHSKQHIAHAQKRKRRIKQKFYSKFILPIVTAKKEAYKKSSEKLEKGLIKLEVQPKKTHKPQKKGEQK